MGKAAMEKLAATRIREAERALREERRAVVENGLRVFRITYQPAGLYAGARNTLLVEAADMAKAVAAANKTYELEGVGARIKAVEELGVLHGR